MKRDLQFIFIIIVAVSLMVMPTTVKAIDMTDYSAYPTFISSTVTPNIMLVLDHSGSMQYPAYIGCDLAYFDSSSKSAECGSSDTSTNPEYNYNSTREYYGYFLTDTYYQYGTNKFEENSACSYSSGDTEYRIGSGTACISGNLLNWASMSRIDLLRKVLIGGKSVSAQDNAHTLRAEGGWRSFTDDNLGCTFDITGGSYPSFSHELSISSTGVAGTCGYVSVWANGSEIWSKKDKFRYVYQTVSGDFDAKLKVVIPPSETSDPEAMAGLMIREGTNSRDENIAAMATNSLGLRFSYRGSYNGNTSQIGSYVAAAYPIWVRIVRVSNLFSLYYSSDGTTWTLHDTQSVSMSTSVLIGMAVSSYSTNTLGKGEFDEFICDNCSGDNFNDGSFNTSIWSAEDINTTQPGNQVESCGGAACPVGPLTTVSLDMDIPSNTKSGIIHDLSDSDLDGDWDVGSPRFGLMIYNGDNVGCILNGISGANMSSFVTALQSEPPYSSTPTGEALYEVWDYFVQADNNSGCNNSAYIQGLSTVKDPWYEDGVAVTCRDSFVLLVSDGEWNGSIDPVVPARGSHVTDIRSDIDDTQILSYYSVYSFGYEAAGENSMQQTAMYGAFDDFDSDTWPHDETAYPSDSKTVTLPASPCDPTSLPMDDECEEWDADDDGLPDTYYEASEGDELESALVQAISDILNKASSGTAVSILSTTGEGEGSIYQAYFLPEKLENLESRKWLGYLQSLFVDKYGNIREDTNGNATLDLTSDYIIEMSYDEDLGSVCDKYLDADGNGVKDTPSTPAATVSIEDISAVWKAGDRLWAMDAADRTIFTTINGYSSVDFTTANAASLQTYLRAADSTESTNIINWVRGTDQASTIDAGHDAGYRERGITIDEVSKVWKLGDIVHSTPTVVSKAIEKYYLLYGDLTYAGYRTRHLKRRAVVYAGANDGMLHAFNAGCFDSTSHKFYSSVNDGTSTCYDDTTEPLGHELWAFIPHNIMPHLKWSTMPDYTHVYTVDLKPKVTDVKIFTSNDMHTNGWGTILIGGLRYGGKDIDWCSTDPDVLCTQDSDCSAAGAGTCSGGSASPEYFALDITDPANPRVLWTFTNAGLGLTMSNPAITKIGNNWYAVFGSGPTDFDSGADFTTFQAGTLFVLDLGSGANGVIDTWTLNTNYWKISTGNTTSFISDPINVDVDMDYDTDVIYFGENYLSGSWNALMQRVTTGMGANIPSAWVLSTLGSASTLSGGNDKSLKITAAPSAAMDDRSNLYVYFGTGQYYGSSDDNQTDTGGFYALKDACWSGSCTTEVTSILDVSVSSVATDGNVSVSGTCGGTISSWSDLLSASYICDGWGMFFEDLTEQTDYTGATLSHAGERVLGKPLVLGGLVLWTTFIPGSDACANLGESNIYAVYFSTGTSYSDYVFGDQSSGDIARVRRLGEGMPSSISAQITSDGTAKGFVQQSTSSILNVESITPISITSGVTGWKNEEID